MAYIPVVGTRYGKYTVVGNSLMRANDGKRVFCVKCDCGEARFISASRLVRGIATQCNICAAKERAKITPPPQRLTGCGELSGTHYAVIKAGAKRRNIPFNISAEYLWKLYEVQQGVCALTGVSISLNRGRKNQNPDWGSITASVDRIDNSKGYEIGNVWWVHKEVNRLKNNYSLEELLYWTKLIQNKHGNSDPSVVNADSVATKEQRLGGEDATNNLPTSARLPTSMEMTYTYFKSFYPEVDDIV